jgi:hypothetical protein
MIRRLLFLFALFILTEGPAVVAQVNCTVGSSASGKLICLIPNQLNLTQGSTQSLAFLNEAIGSQVSDLPLATPASGVIYTIDPKLNIQVPSSATLGPILTQRAETIGKHKFYLAFTYQYFQFEDIDGLGLKNLPIFLPLQNGTAVTATNSRLDLKVNQFTGYFTFGLTSSIDVSVAVPIIDIQERMTTSGIEYGLVPPTLGSTTFGPIASPNGSATGIGDVNLAVKMRLWKRKQGGLSAGAELRLPSGDSQNFLGAGTIGFRPFAVFTYGGRISPHFNIAYEVNGNTNLVTNNQGGNGQLPNRLIYSGGADWGVTRWLTFAADVLEQRVFDAERVKEVNYSIPNSNPNLAYPSIFPFSGSYNRTDASVGFKVKPYKTFIVTANLVVKLDQGGLRARNVPLGGVSVTF